MDSEPFPWKQPIRLFLLLIDLNAVQRPLPMKRSLSIYDQLNFATSMHILTPLPYGIQVSSTTSEGNFCNNGQNTKTQFSLLTVFTYH